MREAAHTGLPSGSSIFSAVYLRFQQLQPPSLEPGHHPEGRPCRSSPARELSRCTWRLHELNKILHLFLPVRQAWPILTMPLPSTPPTLPPSWRLRFGARRMRRKHRSTPCSTRSYFGNTCLGGAALMAFRPINAYRSAVIRISVSNTRIGSFKEAFCSCRQTAHEHTHMHPVLSPKSVAFGVAGCMDIFQHCCVQRTRCVSTQNPT